MVCSTLWHVGGWSVANRRLLTCVLRGFHSLAPRVFTGCLFCAGHHGHLLVTVIARAKEDVIPASPFTAFCACPHFSAHNHLVVWSPLLSPDTAEVPGTEREKQRAPGRSACKGGLC